MVDVLPAPLGPSNPRMRPGCAVNDTWFTAVTLPYRFTTSRTSSILSDRAEERDLRGESRSPLRANGGQDIQNRANDTLASRQPSEISVAVRGQRKVDAPEGMGMRY